MTVAYHTIMFTAQEPAINRARRLIAFDSLPGVVWLAVDLSFDMTGGTLG
jgi:hypothetical protein